MLVGKFGELDLKGISVLHQLLDHLLVLFILGGILSILLVHILILLLEFVPVNILGEISELLIWFQMMFQIVLNEDINGPLSNIPQPQTLILVNLSLNLQFHDLGRFHVLIKFNHFLGLLLQ